MYYVPAGSFSRPFQGVSYTEPALVHQCHYGHNTSLPQAEVQGKGMYDIQLEYSSVYCSALFSVLLLQHRGKAWYIAKIVTTTLCVGNVL